MRSGFCGAASAERHWRFGTGPSSPAERLLRIDNLFRTDFRFAPSLPLRFACGHPPIHGGHGRPRSVRKSCQLRWKHLSTGLHRGDLQKGNVYASWCQSPSTRAQKCRFCARKARKWGFRSRKAHKNLDFVLERPENGGSGGQKRTKTSILCSKSPKTRVPNPKKAQKPRFCARKARKQGFQTQIKHKKPDFVLGKRGNWHREA